MGLLKIHWRRTAYGLAWLGTALVLVGCRTSGPTQLLTTSGPGWRVQQGQALWRAGRSYPELGGDLVVAMNNEGDCLIQFTKTPLPMVIAQTTRTNWYIDFAPRQLSFSGRAPPPTRFAWLYLPAALSHQQLPGRFRFLPKPDGGWRLENTHTGETLEGFLAP